MRSSIVLLLALSVAAMAQYIPSLPPGVAFLNAQRIQVKITNDGVPYHGIESWSLQYLTQAVTSSGKSMTHFKSLEVNRSMEMFQIVSFEDDKITPNFLDQYQIMDGQCSAQSMPINSGDFSLYCAPWTSVTNPAGLKWTLLCTVASSMYNATITADAIVGAGMIQKMAYKSVTIYNDQTSVTAVDVVFQQQSSSKPNESIFVPPASCGAPATKRSKSPYLPFFPMGL